MGATARCLGLLVVLFGTACGVSPAESADPMTEQPTLEAPSAAPVPAGGQDIQGKVLSTLDVSNYTYVELESAEGVVWAAGPRTPVKIGDEVFLPAGAPMVDFYSPSLERRFDVIYFSPRLMVRGAGGDGAAAPPTGAPAHPPTGAPAHPPTGAPAHPPTGAPAHPPTGAAGHPPVTGTGESMLGGGCPTPVADVSQLDVSGVEKLDDGATIAEIVGGREALAGQQVALRGVVVKCNAGILGRTWLHLRDGTTAPGGADDLTVTTDEGAPVGATVVVQGTVALDRDFGYGYRYELLVEDASVRVE